MNEKGLRMIYAILGFFSAVFRSNNTKLQCLVDMPADVNTRSKKGIKNHKGQNYGTDYRM
jgi:hypothetical protein